MISAIAIDDELPALKVLENFCGQTNFISLLKTFNKPHEALRYLQQFPVPLLFLDINMPALSGIDLYKATGKNAMAIFTTAYSEYAVEGFNLNAVDYLLKPFTFERFMQAVNKAQDYYNYVHAQKPDEQYIFIRADYSLIKIKLSDIIFIESLDDYLKIHLQNQRPVVARLTMKVMLEKLPATEFIRVHRSYIVSLNYIQTVRNKTITVNGVNIPVSSSYENEFFNRFNR
ncbi:LytR/AlgR family response regulator transcription factor [Parafilimonas terrae]|uniref:Two component transcriptional regulator, LytTR family n=1 Tax=Parafilimonas terrae TaxID=1465490 RepID=A0A1I5VTH4_9BACT|nr:LytTR family DNA-binding domain-containing protein [Parafilimonas terrae]SFQ10266.1 two component transcriptional regulator, LytTR family [Parafilimonas terrae]